MRTLSRALLAAFVAALGAFGAAADAPPLIKPVTPSGGARVRVPVAEDEKTFMQYKAAITNPKGKKGETVAVKVMLDTLPNMARVELKKWKEWGFEVPANRVGVIPEVVIAGAQIAPKPSKGRDVEYRVKDVKVNIIESAAGSDTVGGGCDLLMSLYDLTGGAYRQFEPRVHFGDKFFELSSPNAAVKRLNTGDATSPDPAATAGDLVPAVGTLSAAPVPAFAFASVNGYARYLTPTGKIETVSVGVSSITNYQAPGILMTVNTAHGCGVALEKQPQEGEVVPGKVKELRLEMLTGAGFKAKKDFVLKDVTVYVTGDRTNAFVWLGPRFVEKYLTDGVYGCGPDGLWRLHGRVKAEYLEDPKTRTPQPPLKKP